MTFEYAFLLALIQGMSEFLPISSSAHLILPSILFGLPDQGMAFDVAVHVGSLGAVILALRVDIYWICKAMLVGFGRRYPIHARLGWMVCLATIPAVIVGLAAKDIIEMSFRDELVIATMTLVFGIFLWWAHYQRGVRGFSSIGVRDALILGVAQAIALIPGTSRSGITLTAGLWLGLSRRIAVKFSFLMSIPIIFGAGLIKTWDLLGDPDPIPWDVLGLGIVMSFISAYLCIRLLIVWIDRIGLLPFVWYRLILGAFLIFVSL